MRRALLLLGVGVVVCVVAATPPAFTQSAASSRPEAVAPVTAVAPVVAAPAATTANVPVPLLTPDEAATLARSVSPDRLAALRSRADALAQRAVLDAQEGLFREPTAAEARALAPTATDAASVEAPLATGGAAIKTDASGVSLLVATVDGAGRVTTSHDTKGARRER